MTSHKAAALEALGEAAKILDAETSPAVKVASLRGVLGLVAAEVGQIQELSRSRPAPRTAGAQAAE